MFKKLIAVSALLLFMGNTPALAKGLPAESASSAMVVEAKTVDNRTQILQKYLAQFNSPLQYNAADFIEAADKYQLDWKLLPAIAGVESTFGKFVPGSDYSPSYNAWGWGVYGTQAIYFKSWREGIFTVAEGLRKNYLNQGLTDSYAINRVYSVSPAWGWKVEFFQKDITLFEAEHQEQKKTELVVKELSKPRPATYPFVRLASSAI